MCRLIIGDSLDVKGALGMPNVALHADATPGYDSAWCQHYNSWPAATPTTGELDCSSLFLSITLLHITTA